MLNQHEQNLLRPDTPRSINLDSDQNTQGSQIPSGMISPEMSI
jgi:hypothetical protein